MLNSLIRTAKFALGDLSPEEFYAQEALEEELDEKLAASS
jgi:hypothetical protein